MNVNLIIIYLLLNLTNGVNAKNLTLEKIESKNWDIYSINEVKLLQNQPQIDNYKLGLLFLAHYDYVNASKYLVQSSVLNTNYYLALSSYKQNNLQEALEYIEEYYFKNKNQSAFLLYFDILNDLAENNKIENLLNTIEFKSEEISAELFYKKGMFYLYLGQCNKAIPFFNKVLELSPTATKINKSLSKAYQSCNKPILAQKFRAKEASGAIVSNNKLLVELYEYGNPAVLFKPKLIKLIEQNKNLEALPLAEKLIKIQPRDENIWINYGSVLKKLNKVNQALEAYKQAYKLNNANELIIKNIIKLYLGKNLEKANHWLDKLLKLQPNHKIGLRLKGDYFKQKNDLKKAIDYYKLSLFQSPENTYLLKQLTVLYLESNQYNIATQMLDDAFRINGKNTVIANYLSRTLMITQYDSEKSVQRALRISKKIFEIKADYTNKFTLVMALRINNLDEEADQMIIELKSIPLRPSQKKYKDAIEILKTKESLLKNLSSEWLW